MKLTKLIKLISISLLGTVCMITSVNAGNVETNYKACAACHGMKAEKKALGKSKVINEMSQEEIETALNGYKDGSYGGQMKALMKAQVMKYNKEEIKELATYIKTLKE